MTASTSIGGSQEDCNNYPSSSSSSKKQNNGQTLLSNIRSTVSSASLTEAEQLELGISMMKNNLLRPEDSDLRVLFFTATYFVLDGVTLTIRRIESHIRAKGADVKILTTVPDDITPEQAKDVIAVPGIKIPFDHAGLFIPHLLLSFIPLTHPHKVITYSQETPFSIPSHSLRPCRHLLPHCARFVCFWCGFGCGNDSYD